MVRTTSVPLATVDDQLLARQEVLLRTTTGPRTSRRTRSAPATSTTWATRSTTPHPDPELGLQLFVDTADGSLRFAPDLNRRRGGHRRDPASRDRLLPWNGQVFGVDDGTSAASELVDKESILEAMYYGYPRAELDAPEMNRRGLMLTDVVLAPFVSDFRVEWT